jgi:hypothetical protein
MGFNSAFKGLRYDKVFIGAGCIFRNALIGPSGRVKWDTCAELVSWKTFLNHVTVYSVGRGSSVGISDSVGLDGLEIEVLGMRDFPQLSRPTLGPTQHPE